MIGNPLSVQNPGKVEQHELKLNKKSRCIMTVPFMAANDRRLSEYLNSNHGGGSQAKSHSLLFVGISISGFLPNPNPISIWLPLNVLSRLFNS